jgi:transcriptional regulator with XRE-family HTH domain
MRASDVVPHLSTVFKRLRRKVGTQEVFAERSGLSQSFVSALERGEGWTALANVTAALERAGVDPAELIGTPTLSTEQQELLTFFEDADPDVRAAVVTVLRAQSRRGRAAS